MKKKYLELSYESSIAGVLTRRCSPCFIRPIPLF